MKNLKSFENFGSDELNKGFGHPFGSAANAIVNFVHKMKDEPNGERIVDEFADMIEMILQSPDGQEFIENLMNSKR